MNEKHGKMPRAEGFVGGRRVGKDEKAIIMGGEFRLVGGVGADEIDASDYSRQFSDQKRKIAAVNETVEKDSLPMITEKEFRNVHSADEQTMLEAEELLKKRIKEKGIDPRQEGQIRILVGNKEFKICIGNDFGTVLSDDVSE